MTAKKCLMGVLVLLLLASVALFAGGEKEAEAGEKVLRIAAVDFPQFQPYKVRVAAARRAAADYGVEYVLLQPGDVTTEAAIETFLNAANQNFDAIICEPWVTDPWVEPLNRVTGRGIPLVNVHVPFPDDTKFISQIYIDNEGYGRTAADILSKATGGEANILFMMNAPDVANQAVQRQTFIDHCAANYPGMKVVATEFTQVDPIIAAERLEAAFRAYPEIDMVIFLESATVTVAADVAKEMGILGKIKIIGIDDPPDLVDSIRAGEVWGSFNQNFQKQGYESVRNIVDYFAKQPFPHQTDAGIVLITKDNVDTYVDKMWEPVALKGKPYPNLK